MTGPSEPVGDPAPLPPPPDLASPAVPASRIPYVDLAGTVALLVTTIGAWAMPGNVTDTALLVASAVLFLGGSAAFVVGFVKAIGRSRYETIYLAGLFYLTGTAPKVVRDSLLRLWFLQIGLAVLGAFVTQPPFGVMAPLWGIGMLTLWGALHGEFAPRPPSPRRGR